jgi:hypothetical protein
MNVTVLLKRNYEQMDTWSIGKNKPKTNPIQTQFKPNTKPKRTQFKAKQTQFQPMSKAKKPSMLLSIMICAATIIFTEFSVLVLTGGSESRKVPLLYFPVVSNRLFEGIS